MGHREELAIYPNGQVALSGQLLRLFRRLDDIFVGWAAAHGAIDHLFPPILPASALARIDYLSSFPHLATFPATLASDEDNLATFVAGVGAGASMTCAHPVALTELSPVNDVLTPAACYHCYLRYQGVFLDGPLFLTTRATCFRREATYTPLERLWSFSMREIVCIGTLGEVETFLAAQRAVVTAFVHRIGLASEWKAATDPFFRAAQNPKHLAQRLDPVKAELVFDDRLAIASVNMHRNYFGEAFEITRAGEPAYSGCVAFGLERWIAAVVSAFGSTDWPGELTAG